MRRWIGDLVSRIAYLAVLATGMIFGTAIALDHHSPFLLVGALLIFGSLPWLLYRHLPKELRRSQNAAAKGDYQAARTHSLKILDQLGRWPGLDQFLRLGVSLGSGSPRVTALNTLAYVAYKEDDLGEAESLLDKALGLDPSNIWGLFLMSVICSNRSRGDEGRAWMAKVAAQAPLGPHRDLVRFARHPPDPGEDYQAIAEAAVSVHLPREGAVQVRILNDDKTPMAFVVAALEDIFGLAHVDAIRVMLAIDRDGSAVCGAFSAEAAEEKLNALLQRAKDANLPLQAELVPPAA